MPGFDGSGPQGRGPMRGDGRGCRNARGVCKPAGRRRCASGDGFGRRSGPMREDAQGLFESEILEAHATLETQAVALRERLAAIEARLASTETT